jgi:hypothetical protein
LAKVSKLFAYTLLYGDFFCFFNVLDSKIGLMRVKGRFFCFLSCCNSQVLFWNKGINKKARHVVKHEWQFVLSILAFSL